MEGELPELHVMSELASAFAALEEDEIRRVLKWANEKYRFKGAGESDKTSMVDAVPPTEREFSDLPRLFDAAKPTSGLDRLLVVGYWHQVVSGEEDLDSQTLNGELKHLGYPSANITRDMASLVNRSPKLVIQVRKDGTSQQARKRFRLTREGIKSVQSMLAKTAGEE